jgi:hypothetical protein
MEAPTVTALGRCLERLWEQRTDLRKMGLAGAQRIRKLVPPDPARIFAEKIKSLLPSDGSVVVDNASCE